MWLRDGALYKWQLSAKLTIFKNHSLTKGLFLERCPWKLVKSAFWCHYVFQPNSNELKAVQNNCCLQKSWCVLKAGVLFVLFQKFCDWCSEIHQWGPTRWPCRSLWNNSALQWHQRTPSCSKAGHRAFSTTQRGNLCAGSVKHECNTAFFGC